MAITTSGASITFNDATTQTTAFTGIPTIIPSGTVMLFYQAAAPTAWTQVTTLNDYDLRLVSGTGGTTGGTTAYSTVFANQTPTFSGAIGSLAVGATTLTTTTMPSHAHSVLAIGGGSYGGLSGKGASGIATTTTSSTGSDGAHSHSISGVPGGTVGAVTLNVRYANIIICSKN